MRSAIDAHKRRARSITSRQTSTTTCGTITVEPAEEPAPDPAPDPDPDPSPDPPQDDPESDGGLPLGALALAGAGALGVGYVASRR